MKEVEEISLNVFEITSEPGDATRYSYLIIRDYDEFCIAPFKSAFRFPQRLNYWEIQDLTEEELITLANKENCNLFTLKEVIRTINELYNRWRNI